MIIIHPATTQATVTLASSVDAGTVFTGRLSASQYDNVGTAGVFLKLHGHVVSLETYAVYVAGALSELRIFGYYSWPCSFLSIKDF